MSGVTQEDRIFMASICRNTEAVKEILAGKADAWLSAQMVADFRTAAEARGHARSDAGCAIDAAEARHREAMVLLEWISDEFASAIQSDCESGVRWLNERAAADYLKDAPDTLKAIQEMQQRIGAFLDSEGTIP